jgi:Domain of unknown function (DUF6431)
MRDKRIHLKTFRISSLIYVEGRENRRWRVRSHELHHPPETFRAVHSGLRVSMQILYPFVGTIQQYNEQCEASNPKPLCSCALCGTKRHLRAHGFYRRWVGSPDFDGMIRVRRYLCLACRRTISLLPEFVLPYVRSTIMVLGLFFRARLLEHKTLKQSAIAAGDSRMPYQRGQQWVRRFCCQAASLSAALAALTKPPDAVDFVARALTMLEATGWIAAHRFLFERLRLHLLGWPRFLAPHGRSCAL